MVRWVDRGPRVLVDGVERCIVVKVDTEEGKMEGEIEA